MVDDSVSVEVRDSLSGIEPQQWNALSDTSNPFVSYEFLYSLECTGCMGKHNGWYPRYFLLWDSGTPATLLGAMPCYLKTNSYVEFVFDWAWAEAYERNNLDYYPKLVCSIPFTPATGPRILVHDSQPYDETVCLLANAARQFCTSQGYSSVHWLFITEQESRVLCANDQQKEPQKDQQNEQQKEKDDTAESDDTNGAETDAPVKQLELLQRTDCQYHWKNDNYTSFDDFLTRCTAKRRKTIRRERRYVTDAPLKITRRIGSTLSDEEWMWVHELYASTFDRKWGNPSLTFEFFKRIGRIFGGNVLVVMVNSEFEECAEKPIACSIMFFGKSTLYGRYWGCSEEHHSLHFEACYYQGIEFCIERGLSVFEPGAQGEHKITRGFYPTVTRSAHYIVHSGFREAIADFLAEERQHVEHRCTDLTNLLPYKKHSTIS